jgi:hypothetical protein
MTEAERLRSQAERCEQLARDAKHRDIADTLRRLAAKSLEQALDLEQQSDRRPAHGVETLCAAVKRLLEKDRLPLGSGRAVRRVLQSMPHA